ncbi:MAG: ABC transporter ATP-binding protein [Anaerolineae bacterium]|jgi:ABC-type Fe3+/spermidine/putrescine transport system ATPase subunit
MALLTVTSVSKSFAGTPILSDVSFDVEGGEIVCLLGPSGCGKTTLLRIITGLEAPEAGHVTFDGQPFDKVPAHQRGFGLMFQDYALFPHKDVAANVAFGLRMQDLPRSQVTKRVTEMLNLVGLSGYEQRRVYDLSGGEQQRVALARSLAPDPRLLMLDEPLGSLDRALREELMNELRAILKRVGVTAIYVTHDQQEAFAVADRVLVMRQGHIVQEGTSQAVYRHPASTWVARFLGLTNLISGHIVTLDPCQVDTLFGRLTVGTAGEVTVGQEVTVLIRPEAARLAVDCPDEGALSLEGRVQACSFRGGRYRLVIWHETGIDLTFELTTEAAKLPRRGERVSLSLRPEAISLLVEKVDE